jgi:hypothetical protein
MFYNTGIATYVWVLSNKKPDRRKGKVQLIDASLRGALQQRGAGKSRWNLPAGRRADDSPVLRRLSLCEESKRLLNALIDHADRDILLTLISMLSQLLELSSRRP